MNSLLKWNCTALFLVNCHVMLKLLREKLLTFTRVRGFCTTEHRKQRDIILQERSVMCGVDLLEGGMASRCCTQPQCLMEPPPVPASSLPSIFFIHLERLCDKWKRGRYKSLSGCTGVVFQIYYKRKYSQTQRYFINCQKVILSVTLLFFFSSSIFCLLLPEIFHFAVSFTEF